MFWMIIIISSISVVSTVIGVSLAYLLAKNKKVITFSFGFSTSVILLLASIDLLLKPLEYEKPFFVFSYFLLGAIFILFLDYLIPHFHFFNKKQNKTNLLKLGYLIAVGLIIHDLPEGFSIASTYLIEKNWGLLVGLAVALHNIPEEFIMAFPFVLSRKNNVLITLAMLSALAEPSGAILGIFTLNIFKNLAPLLTVFTGGAMIMIAVRELLPLGIKNKLEFEFYGGAILGSVSYFLLKFLV